MKLRNRRAFLLNVDYTGLSPRRLVWHIEQLRGETARMKMSIAKMLAAHGTSRRDAERLADVAAGGDVDPSDELGLAPVTELVAKLRELCERTDDCLREIERRRRGHRPSRGRPRRRRRTNTRAEQPPRSPEADTGASPSPGRPFREYVSVAAPISARPL